MNKETKKCQNCLSTKAKLQLKRDLLGKEITGSYICVNYWNGCRERYLKKLTNHE